MPAGAIIGAVGSVAGGIAGGKGAKKAAKIQAQANAQQQALLKQIYNENAGRFGTDISRGDAAGERIQALLGLSGGDGANATAILRSTPGYQFRMDQGLNAVNANAYAKGLGNSGATQRALMATGQGIADQTFNQYVGQLTDVANRGSAGKSSIAGVSQNYANASNTITQNAADTRSNYQMFKAANFTNTLNGVLKAGGQAFGSSFGGSSGSSGMGGGVPAPANSWFGRG